MRRVVRRGGRGCPGPYGDKRSLSRGQATAGESGTLPGWWCRCSVGRCVRRHRGRLATWGAASTGRATSPVRLALRVARSFRSCVDRCADGRCCLPAVVCGSPPSPWGGGEQTSKAAMRSPLGKISTPENHKHQRGQARMSTDSTTSARRGDCLRAPRLSVSKLCTKCLIRHSPSKSWMHW